jgi:hypothetical protein
MENIIEFIKINHFSDYKLPMDVIELIFEKYIIQNIINNSDDYYLIDNIDKPNLFLIKILKKYNYELTSETLINAIKNNNIKLIKYLLDADIDIGDSLIYAISINNLEIIKELVNNGAYILTKHICAALKNNNIELADYLANISNISYYDLLESYHNKNSIKWIFNKKENFLLNMNNLDKVNLILNVIKNNDIELLNLLISKKMLILSCQIIYNSFNNIEIVKILNDYVKNNNNNNIYFHGIDNNNIFMNNPLLAILSFNNLELLKLYFNSNINETIFSYSSNNVLLNDTITLDLSSITNNKLSNDIIKYLYTNLTILYDEETFYIITCNNLNILKWLYDNNYIINFHIYYLYYDNSYECKKFIIDKLIINDDNIKYFLTFMNNLIEKQDILILKLCHNKIMQSDDKYIIEWKDTHYDALDFCDRYNMMDSINFMTNENIWFKNNINYLSLYKELFD